jgi:hypothetical protein
MVVQTSAVRTAGLNGLSRRPGQQRGTVWQQRIGFRHSERLRHLNRRRRGPEADTACRDPHRAGGLPADAAFERSQ